MGAKVFMRCTRCNGKGILKAFSHVEGGVCFRCRVEGYSAGAGDMVGEVTFDGRTVRVNGFLHVRMADVKKLSRKEMIAEAARTLGQLDGRGPHGCSFIQLVAFARVADAKLSRRILAALRARVAGKDFVQAEVEALIKEFRLADEASHPAV